jgi:glycosyltransferase involved in cell wall biosynthesis
MIVRDGGATLARALSSALPWVDDALVLDTGSADDSVRIAEMAGARVERAFWRDDFSLARNQALELAQADWNLILDADEWLEDGGSVLAQLREQKPNFVGSLCVESTQGHEGNRSSVPAWLPRLLPAGVRYSGRVHEHPQHRLQVRQLPVHLGHCGYWPGALAAKSGRNARLLQASLAEQPDDAYLWFQLGKDHDVYERYAEAVTAFDRAEALLGAHRPAWQHDLVVRRLHALKRCGQHAFGMTLAEQGVRLWADSPDYFFALGDLLLDWAAEEPERASSLLPMIEDAWKRCLALGERPELEGAVRGRGSFLAAGNLALLYDVIGRPEDAAHCRALSRQPSGSSAHV